MIDKNVEYYNINAQSFYENSVNADMSDWRDRFEKLVPAGGSLLDVGCGSGRDSLAFINHGFKVEAFDASEEMCKRASKLINQEVQCKRFQDIDYNDCLDGVWACASLLHVPSEELDQVLDKLYRSIKKNGIIYASFKYGEGIVTRGERVFIDMNEKTVCECLERAGFEVVECGITSDVRPGRSEEKWINCLARKIN